MLAKCVNSVCSAQFRFLHQGKLFEVEIQYARTPTGKVQVERYWLCDQCAEQVTLWFDKCEGLVVHSPAGREKVRGLSSGRSVAEISQVRIRPLDINLAAGRGFTGNPKVRRQAA